MRKYSSIYITLVGTTIPSLPSILFMMALKKVLPNFVLILIIQVLRVNIHVEHVGNLRTFLKFKKSKLWDWFGFCKRHWTCLWNRAEFAIPKIIMGVVT